MRQPLRRLGSALSELRRRRVFHVLAFYAVVAWLAVQVTDIAVPALHLPSGTLTLVFFLALLGFPIVALLAWAYDITPGGIERTGRDPLALDDPTDPMSAFRHLRRRGAAGGEPGDQAEATRGRSQEAEEPSARDAQAVSAARLVLATFILLLTGALGWMGWQLWFQPEPAEVQAAEAAEELDPTRVAVLYFDDHSEAGDLGPFANGFTEALIHELTQVPSLDVVSRFGVKPFRGGGVTVDSIVRVVRAGSLIEGSVQRSDDKLRVTVQLVDGATGTHLESTTLERPWGELFELQDELVERASVLLRERLGTSLRLRDRRAATESVEAWTLVRRAEALRDDANELWAVGEQASAERALDQADSLLRLAEAEDPRWWESVTLQGWTAADRARHAGAPALDAYDAAWIRRGLREADRALALRPGNPGALALRGKLALWLSENRATADGRALRESAEADLRAAVDGNPNLAEAWNDLSDLLRRQGRLPEARLAGRRALEADAFLQDAQTVIWRLHTISLDLRDLDEAGHWCDEGRRRFPQVYSFYSCALFHLALPGGPEPDVDRAWALYHDFTAASPEQLREQARVGGLLFVAAVLARADRPDSARALVGTVRSRDIPPEVAPWADYYEANVRLHLGERDAALELLETYVEALPGRRDRLPSDWMLEELWDDPRFQALARPAPG